MSAVTGSFVPSEVKLATLAVTQYVPLPLSEVLRTTAWLGQRIQQSTTRPFSEVG